MKGVTLSHLPTDVLDVVGQHLDLSSLKNLRLASRALRDKSFSPHFRKFFQCPKIALSLEGLDSLEKLVSHPILGSTARSLALQTLVYDTTAVERVIETKTRNREVISRYFHIPRVEEIPCTADEVAKAKQDLQWLQAKMRHSVRNTTSLTDRLASIFKRIGHLEVLELDGIGVYGPSETGPVHESGDWVPAWKSATRAFCVVTSAIVASGVQVDSLAIFRNTLRCSVQSVDIANHLPKLDADSSAAIGKTLKSFSISFSTRTRIQTPDVDEQKVAEETSNLVDFYMTTSKSEKELLTESDPEAVEWENFIGVAGLLRKMPNLEVLELHQYTALNSYAGKYDKLFRNTIHTCTLPALKQVFLGGLFVNIIDMIAFLHDHPTITHLDLEQVHLRSGFWELMFTQLSRMPNLEYLRLSMLMDRRFINLDPIDWFVGLSIDESRDCYPLIENSYITGRFVHTREIPIHELRKGLRFKPAIRSLTFGSESVARHGRHAMVKYGPPHL